MRWFPWFILAYVAIGVQIGAGEFLRFHGAKPDLVLLAVIFIAINAPREPALLGAFLMGMMTDLVSGSPLGLYALSYALVAMFTVSTQEIVYREHPITHFSLAFFGSLLMGAIAMIHGWFHAARLPPTLLFASAVYTAALAPILLGIMQRLKRVFAFQSARRRMRGVA
jgi:rod shape-determining protein MreD